MLKTKVVVAQDRGRPSCLIDSIAACDDIRQTLCFPANESFRILKHVCIPSLDKPGAGALGTLWWFEQNEHLQATDDNEPTSTQT